jgi:YD repeat-containing protein
MKKLIVAIALLLVPVSGFSTLWLLNGNFSLRYTDIDEGNNFELERFYNSLSLSKGMFGYGWGSHFETKLYVVDGPFVMIEEVPGGGRSHYITKGTISLSQLVDKYLKATNASSNGKDYAIRLKTTLLKEPTLLFEFAKRYKMYGKVKDGSVLECIERSGEVLRKTKGGYIRTGADGVTDEFDSDGKIIKRVAQAGRGFVFSYTINGKLQSIRDSLGRSMNFFFNTKGLLDRIALYNGKAVTYSYDDNDNLSQSTDTSGKTYKYKYDSYHRVVEIFLPTGKWNIGYDTETGKVVYQKTPQGWEIFTEYANDKGKNQYYESVSLVKKFGNEVISEKYEFWKRPDPEGSLYTYKTREKIGNREKTVTYTMCCGTPLVVNENGRVTRFEYNKDGKLKKKVLSDGRIVDVKYDDKKHVSSIINNGEPYMFKYNDKDQIVLAASKELKFKIDYNGNGNVSNIVDNKKNSFSFKYDENGKLKEVYSKDAALVVQYTDNGVPVVMPKDGNDDTDKLWSIRKTYLDYIELMSVFSLIEIED